MATWFDEAGLTAEKVQRLPGDPLTVMIWKAVRPAYDLSVSLDPTSHKTLQAVE